MFLSSYRNTRESLGELKNCCGNTCLLLMFPEHFSFSQIFTHVSIQSSREKRCTGSPQDSVTADHKLHINYGKPVS